MVELPAEAKARLRNLELAKISAEDRARSAGNRLNMLATGGNPDPELCAALDQERDEQNHRHNELSRIFNSIRQWLTALPRSTALEMAPVPVIDPKKAGADLGAAIANTRKAIAVARQEIATIRSMPPSASELRQQAHSAAPFRQALASGRTSMSKVSSLRSSPAARSHMHVPRIIGVRSKL
jgi:hypothetical protein